MIGKVTNDELSKVLMEFHQRNQSLIRPPGPPAPFEITTSVVQQQPILHESRRQDSPPDFEQNRALAIEEKYYEFVPTTFTGGASGPFMYVGWFFRCKTEGSIAHESYIRTYPGGYWQSVNPPGYSGAISYAFNQSTWFPPPFNEQGAWVFLTITMYGLPDPVLHPILLAHIYFATYIQQVDDPNNISLGIYPAYSIYAWNWYNAQNGIGFDLTFHYPGP